MRSPVAASAQRFRKNSTSASSGMAGQLAGLERVDEVGETRNNGDTRRRERCPLGRIVFAGADRDGVDPGVELPSSH